MTRILDFYKKNRVVLIAVLALFIIGSLSLQLYLFFRDTLTEEDIVFEDLSWSEFCDGNVYTPEEKKEFCDACFEFGGEKCEWPLDITVIIDKVEGILKKGGEVHCYLIINGVNYYYEKGKYYGVITRTFFTWDLLDATKSHSVEVCCGIEGQSPIATLVGLEKKWPQACVQKEVGARCIAG